MNKLNLMGGIFGTSGYNSHTIQLAKALDKLTDLSLETNLPPEWPALVNDKTLSWISKKYPKETTIAITQPWFWPLKLADKPKKFIGYVVWEGDKVPEGWIEHLIDPRVDYIFVPSQHTKDAILKTFQEYLDLDTDKYTVKMNYWNKVKIIPHGVDIELFKPNKKKEDDTFTFLCNKGWTGGMEDRGGVQYVLKAFDEEFKKSEKVRLIIKLNMAYVPPNWNWKKAIEDIGIKKREDSPQVFVNPDTFPYQKMPELYNMADCFVCPTRSEAFGLTMLEAMACGLPAITTNFGGQIDFVNEDNGWLIGGKLEEIKHDIQYEGIKWLTPSIEELKKTMRYAFEHQDEVKIKGEKAAEKAKELTWDNTAKEVLEWT